MKNLDVLRLSTRIFKTNKMRTTLTVLGIGVGIGAILFLVSLGYGLQQVILGKITSDDALLALDILSGTSEELNLDQGLVEKMLANDKVAEVSPLVSYNSFIDLNNFSGGTEAEFVKSSFFRLSGLELESGKVFDDNETKKIVVSSAILKLFGIPDGKLDYKDIKITVILQKEKTEENPTEAIDGEVELVEIGDDFVLSGVVKDDVNPFIYVNIENIKDFKIGQFDQLKIKAKNKGVVGDLRDEIFDMGYGVSSISETIDQINKVFTVIQIVLGAFGVIALTVSAIGMFNTMTISLLQRTKEVGIMKAIGAKNKDVKKLFLAEALLIGFLGGTAGIGLGYLFQMIFNFLLNMLAKTMGGDAMNVFFTPGWFILLIMGFSTIVGFLTGVWPAMRASKLNPLDALRYK